MFKPTANVLSRFSLLFAVTALAGCGGSSGGTTTVTPVGPSGDTPEDTSSGTDDFSGKEVQGYFVGDNATLKAGVFLGRLTYTNGTFVDGLMFLSPTGNYSLVLDTDSSTADANFIADANIISGTMTLDGLAIESSVVEYELFDKWYRSTGSLAESSSVTPNASTSAVLYSGGIVDKVEITRDNDTRDKSLSFSEIASGTGIYEAFGSGSQITIDVEGWLTGVDRGCLLEGQITIPVAEINIYEISYEASGCSDLAKASGFQRDGKYLGVGTFTPAADSEGEGDMEFAASNGKIAFYFAGTK